MESYYKRYKHKIKQKRIDNKQKIDNMNNNKKRLIEYFKKDNINNDVILIFK